MLSCWAEMPERRPPFETLRQDLDDFDVACEAKYKNYDEWIPNYSRHGKRDGKINKRKKKKAVIKFDKSAQDGTCTLKE